ncbi:hypothetical protein BJV78DRAFT_1154853 [Lactifluus subvellereus]|nr:hypothetical protein BJV78DRAFT_1154853 [Lactifluus subvellereus]
MLSALPFPEHLLLPLPPVGSSACLLQAWHSMSAHWCRGDESQGIRGGEEDDECEIEFVCAVSEAFAREEVSEDADHPALPRNVFGVHETLKGKLAEDEKLKVRKKVTMVLLEEVVHQLCNS